jgi:uncharacterized protein RhaS with RHS repeats
LRVISTGEQPRWLRRQFGGLGNRIIGETDGAGNRSREYVWLDDQVIAVVSDANTASPSIWWVTNDHLGRPVQMTDWSKTVVWRANHWPFGEVTAVTGTASLDARFPGQWFQLESGLAYNCTGITMPASAATRSPIRSA